MIGPILGKPTKRAWRRLSGRKLDTGATPKELTFGIDFRLDPNTAIAFRLDAKLPEGELERILDEAIAHVREVKLNAQYEHPLFAHYDVAARRWVILDPMEEIRRIHFPKEPATKRRNAKAKPTKAKRGRAKRK